jgi:hypothetical protein
MSTSGSSTSAPPTQQPAASPTQDPPSKRGRGTRGGRGRGRGSGSASQPKQETRLTFQERTAQVASSSAAPVTQLPVAPVPLSTLSTMMDSVFPVQMDPVDYVSDVLVDANGYTDLCAAVYHNITVQKEEYQKLLSQDEFMLCCGWLLAYRAISVRNTIVPVTINGYLEMEQSMRALPPIPEPISQYLEGMGLYRDAYGNTLCPNLALPIRREHVEGIIPGLLSEEMHREHPELYNSMFPFGMYERRIMSRADEDKLPYLRIRMLNNQAVNEDADGFDQRTLFEFRNMTHWMPFPHVSIQPHERRIMHMPSEPSIEGLTLLKSIRWHRTVFIDFLSFLQRVQKVISCVPYPSSTAGSPAMSSCAVPPAPTTVRPDNFKFYSYMALTKSEQHASRLFRYRQRLVERTQSAVNSEQYTASYEMAPHQLCGTPPLQLTELKSTRMYIQFYVSKFLKS